MSSELRKAILGNVGTIIAFSVGSEDARILEGEFAPVFNLSKLCSIGRGQINLKLMIGGKTSDPFHATTLKPLGIPKISYKDRIIQNSRKKYGRNAKDINIPYREREEKSPSKDISTDSVSENFVNSTLSYTSLFLGK